MAKCTKSNCSKPQDPKGGGLCADHLRLKKQEDQKQAQQKAAMEKKAKEEEELRKQMAADALKKQQAAVNKAKKIQEIAVQWNAKVKEVVDEVKHLRTANPTVHGINAGNNGDLGTIPGGTGNPLKFTVPSNEFKITSAEVFAKMSGFDSSDSGTFKFRIGDIFVHGH